MEEEMEEQTPELGDDALTCPWISLVLSVPILTKVVLGAHSRASLCWAGSQNFAHGLLTLTCQRQQILLRQGDAPIVPYHPLFGEDSGEVFGHLMELVVLECQPVLQGVLSVNTSLLLTEFKDPNQLHSNELQSVRPGQPLCVSDFAHYTSALWGAGFLLESGKTLDSDMKTFLQALECRLEVMLADLSGLTENGKLHSRAVADKQYGLDADNLLVLTKPALQRLGLFNREWVLISLLDVATEKERGIQAEMEAGSCSGPGALGSSPDSCLNGRLASVLVVEAANSAWPELADNVAAISHALWFNISNGSPVPTSNGMLKLKALLCNADELDAVPEVMVGELPYPLRLISLPIGRAVTPRDTESERDLQARPRRVDFSNVVLTATFDLESDQFNRDEEEESECAKEWREGGKEEGTKEQSEGRMEQSESSSEESEKSTECSQEAAPSTLLADDQREGRCRASGADGEQELEEGSKTLVLFSPGDIHKSPMTADLAPDADLGTLAAVTPQSERPQALGSQLDVSEPGTLSSVIKSEVKAPCPVVAAATTCPFTKVERTFLHIAEKTHLNVMSSTGQLLPQDHYEFFQPRELENGNWSMAEGVDEAPPTLLQLKTHAGETIAQNGVGIGMDSLERNGKPEHVRVVGSSHVPERESSQGKEKECIRSVTGEVHSRTAGNSQWKSRIPVLMSEEDTGSENSAPLSFKDRLIHRRSRHLDLARFLMDKRQSRLVHLSSVTSSSASSVTERRQGSGSSPATASEEDTNSDSSLNRVGKGSEAHSPSSRQNRAPGSKSKIPRPVTPVKLSPVPSSPSTSPLKPSPTQRFFPDKFSVIPPSVCESDAWMKQSVVPPSRPGIHRGSLRTPSPALVSRCPTFQARSLSASPRIRPLSRTESPSPCRRRRLNTVYPGSTPRSQPSPQSASVIHDTRPGPQASATRPAPQASATRPDPQASATRPGPQASATRPGSQASATRPDLQASATRPDPQASATRPGSQASATRPDPQASSTRPGSQASATRPDLQASATRPGSQASATRPDLQAYATRPGSQASATKGRQLASSGQQATR
ncbi:tau-tubulin kinase 1-like [Scyliorhinus canicula]|uniref:tau-tubulin kinase 1-like n=1 Tax=Scyliorhinus canicula TaxID=7830 RepID=UPI0018F6DB7B|nr:tau-tubulin kinase 1-like [Scyliorhinus canicula]